MVVEIWWGKNRAASKIAILGVSKFAGLHGPFAARILLKNALFHFIAAPLVHPLPTVPSLFSLQSVLGGFSDDF